MRTLTDLEYLKLNKFQKFGHNFLSFFVGLPSKFKSLGLKIYSLLKRCGRGFINFFKTIGHTFAHGDWKTKISFFIMGFGNVARGQIFRGVMFFLFEAAFVVFMVFVGVPNLSKLGTLGTVVQHEEEYIDPVLGPTTRIIPGDNSFKILLYGVLAIFFIAAFIYTWYQNVKQNKISEEILATGKPLKSGKQDAQSLVDDQFHKSLLALPTLGIVMFTVLPTFFMILIAFTNYNIDHTPPELFTWVGFTNFNSVFSWSDGSSNFSATFGEVLLWTLIWAFFATFTNYFLGMLVALAINKKGIKGKKIFRGILVLTIAIPQFISLLFIRNMFATDGIINGILLKWGWLSEPFDFMGHSALSARITVIGINIWVGIPYLMLMISGVLMNIPSDLYESAKIDGANAWQQYTKITLPYALFVTGPFLLTSFTSNMNNFNVIYLLTGGGPNLTIAKSAGETDLLVTWLFKLTVDDNNFSMAAVIGILVFIIVAVISLIVYNVLPSMKNEEDFQ